MKKKDKLSNPSFRGLASLGLQCDDAAAKYIATRAAPDHAKWVKMRNKFRAVAKAVLKEELFEQPGLFEDCPESAEE